MRIDVTVRAPYGTLPWEHVHSPGRGLVYQALAGHAPELGRQLHAAGFGPYHLRPFGFQPPVFPQARRHKGRYTVGGIGTLSFATPLIACAEALTKEVMASPTLRWGPLRLEVASVRVLDPPRILGGTAELRTTTPVLVKGEARGSFLLPDDPTWLDRLRSNLRRKAATFAVDDAVDVELLRAKSRRNFQVSGSARIGAPVAVRVTAAPETLAILWSWGLGQGNSAGFGWIE